MPSASTRCCGRPPPHSQTTVYPYSYIVQTTSPSLPQKLHGSVPLPYGSLAQTPYTHSAKDCSNNIFSNNRQTQQRSPGTRAGVRRAIRCTTALSSHQPSNHIHYPQALSVSLLRGGSRSASSGMGRKRIVGVAATQSPPCLLHTRPRPCNMAEKVGNEKRRTKGQKNGRKHERGKRKNRRFQRYLLGGIWSWVMSCVGAVDIAFPLWTDGGCLPIPPLFFPYPGKISCLAAFPPPFSAAFVAASVVSLSRTFIPAGQHQYNRRYISPFSLWHILISGRLIRVSLCTPWPLFFLPCRLDILSS